MHNFQPFLSPAKINLFLHITGQRDDGYHNLQSVFSLLDFYDTIHLKIRDDEQVLRVEGNDSVPAADDLCVRAARALQAATNCTFGVEIRIEKRIPMGGGLGGGSSNAATVLLALNQLWQLNLSRQVLMQIGLTLGADVPVFIFGQTAWAEGIGEQLTALPLPSQTFVVLTPQIHVSTAQIFAHPQLTRDTKPLRIADFSDAAFNLHFKNDFEQVVTTEYPAVALSLKFLNQFGQARMSGTGASVFVAVKDAETGEAILAQAPVGTSGFMATSLQRHPLYDFCV